MTRTPETTVTEDLLFAIRDEAARGRTVYGPHHSAHEAWAVLHEEMDELWDEVRKKCPDDEAMVLEALQIAAMALRFIQDICPEGVTKRICKQRRATLTVLPKTR